MGDDQSIPYAAGPGFAALATGDLPTARRVAEFLARIHEAQTELPDRFFYDWSRARQAPTREFDPKEAFWYVVENQADRNQRWTIGGIAAGFLCRLYLAEPRPEYLDLARRYQAFSMAATPAQFKYGPGVQERLGLIVAVRDHGRARVRGVDLPDGRLVRRAPGSGRASGRRSERARRAPPKATTSRSRR